ncbi:MAG: ShlB/FhaC/HecB family hemolysin secretion/activation protein [Burkholderiales bacterium]|nr:MAG: ShlB/FhaC/HecB family hemolysin secretion/activation protein [Burkholderiales bacterium]
MNSGFDTAHFGGRPAGGLPVRIHAVAAAVLVLAAAVPVVAGAQGTPAPMPVASNPTFAIKGFKITGENPLGDGDTTRVLAPFLRADATIDTLQKATAALETALRDKGFGLHRVALPPQEVGDTVTLNIIKFAIGKISTEGRKALDEANIRRSVPELREGSTPNFRTLAVQTAIANENQGKQIQVSLKESEEPDKIDANIVVQESKPWNFSISANNTGSSATGRDRLTFAGGHSNVFNRDHQFVGAYTTSLQRSGDVKQVGLNYRIPLYALGGVIGASYTRSDVVGNFGAFSSTGAGHTAGINYTHYLPPDGGFRSYVSFGLDDKVFDATQINGVAIPGQTDRRSRPLSIGYNARLEADNAFWNYNVEFAMNTGGGANNTLAAYQSEDPRISSVHFKALRAGGTYVGGFAGKWLWSARAQAQYSPDSLISGEQFGLGGASSVRGTTERPLSGDKGLFTSLEVTTPEVATGLRFLGFVDAGWLRNNATNATTKPPGDKLSSVGLGLRYASTGFAVSADYGRLMTSSNVPLAGFPQKGDDKIHLNLSVRF